MFERDPIHFLGENRLKDPDPDLHVVQLKEIFSTYYTC
jgi:hypothetical protein